MATCPRPFGAKRQRPPKLSGASLALVLLTVLLTGCMPGTPLTREIEAHARPILTMDPRANWTAHFNRLLALAPASVDYLVQAERFDRPAPPDDLGLLLRTSLVRLLAVPGAGPELSVTCLETTLSLLHFDPRVHNRRLGEAVIVEDAQPRAWHEVFPAEFSHGLAADVNLEADRRAVRQWWVQQRRVPGRWAGARPLAPRAEWLWPLLERRRADRWTYEPVLEVRRCAAGLQPPSALCVPTSDYNLVRAACVWLGTCPDEQVEAQLIELVASPSEIISHNARFALGHSLDERLRRVIERFERREPPPASRRLLVSGPPTQLGRYPSSHRGVAAPARSLQWLRAPIFAWE